MASSASFEMRRSMWKRPIFFSLLIIVAAYLPLFTLERVERQLFTPMAFTVFTRPSGSMLIALTLIPASPPTCSAADTSWETRFSHGCSGATTARFAGRCGIRGGWLSWASPSWWCWPQVVWRPALGTEFLPQLDEGVLWVRAGTFRRHLFSTSRRNWRRRSQPARQSPEVKQVTLQTGRNDDGHRSADRIGTSSSSP